MDCEQTLRQTTENLRKVLAINNKINSTLDIDELLTVIMKTAAEVMRAETASLLLLDDKCENLIFRVALGDKGSELVEKFRVKVGEGIAGHVASCGESVIVNDCSCNKRFAQRFDNETGFVSKAIICVPLKAKGKITGVLEAINPIGRKAFDSSDLDLFQTFADQASIAVENAKLHGEIIKQEKARQELKIAREIQQNFLPDLSGGRFGIDLAALNFPAREVSGDFYDALLFNDTQIGILIADVSGKGVPAALFMVNAITHYRFLAPKFQSPAALLDALNNTLAQNTTRGMFMTALYLIIDVASKTLVYSSAGHHPILRRTSEGEILELENTGGVPLGLMEDVSYSEKKVLLRSGDCLFLYTDGITEARSKAGTEYGMSGLRTCIGHKHSSAAAYADALLKDLEAFTQGADQHDDMTALVAGMP